MSLTPLFLHSANTYVKEQVLLKTAVSTIQSEYTTAEANILFDEGAQRSFMTESMAERLHVIPTRRESIQLSGFGAKQRQVRHLGSVTIYLQTDESNIPINVLIVPEIAVPLKTCQREVTNLPYLQGLKLAHPLSDSDDFEISLLIGADYYWQIVQDRVIRGNGPTAVQSKIGYLLSGPLHRTTESPSLTSMMNVITLHVSEQADLEKFWNIEALGVEGPRNDYEYEKYLEGYQSSAITFREGKYYAKLPWKENHLPLPRNEAIARRRTEYVISKLSKEPALLQKYSEIISEQEQRGFIEKVSKDEAFGKKIHYIPHHPVKKDSVTTPIRIVYDCSCKSSRDSASLNDCLLNTPPHLNNLTSILLRFRDQKYAVTTDIEKAFLNVGLNEGDRDVTRFFWLSNPDDPNSPLQTYRFRSVLFGATCSPFILNAVIMKHINSSNCSMADRFHRDLYVDNLISSLPNEQMLEEYFFSGQRVFQEAGFKLRSWAFNHEALRDITRAEGIMDQDKETKVLGMRWNTKSDKMTYKKRELAVDDANLTTKRDILKESSTIFDPLGILSPITVKCKMFMQSLWEKKYNWDEILPKEVIADWEEIRSDIEKCIETEIPRCYFSSPAAEHRTLHVFTDASLKAYGACAYLVSRNESTLVMAKNRVSPLKQLTIPKLELSAAVIGARLCDHITSSISCTRVFLWSDSQIVLKWLSSPKPQTPFVRNRVTEITTLTNSHEWRYCPTDCNPADLLSRGVSFEKFKNNPLWMNGPPWLLHEEKFPVWENHITTTLTSITETCETVTHTVNTEEHNANRLTTSNITDMLNISRFSSYKRLLNVTAYVLRFISNCRRKEKMHGTLNSHEIDSASRVLIAHAQSVNYQDIVHYFDNCRQKKPNLIRQLDLFMDEDRIIRCGGRIVNSTLDERTKHPYLLPPKDKLTDLIISDAHIPMLHSGIESTVTFLRQNFWIPTIRQRVKTIIHKCITCRKVIGQPYRVPDAPPLPKDRLLEAPPFTVTGVDFSGYLNVKNKNGSIEKAYICLFTCANTRAAHLDVVPNLTTETFILAFRRFCSRKSTPKIMMSDNALTYIATAAILKEEVLNSGGITWKFIPQHAPWYGGWWERLIGVTKNCIKKVLGKALVSMEVLQTVITEIECIINDRPLTFVSSDPIDKDPLTPSQLLYGRQINSPVYPDNRQVNIKEKLTHGSANKISRIKSATLEQFWSRWKHEYLTSLRERHRTSGNEGDTVKIGDYIQIHDEYIPRNKWSLGLIQDVITSGDGRVRAAIVRCRRGSTTRPISKLYPLEVTPNGDEKD